MTTECLYETRCPVVDFGRLEREVDDDRLQTPSPRLNPCVAHSIRWDTRRPVIGIDKLLGDDQTASRILAIQDRLPAKRTG